jgi:hypothetical protein
MKEAGIYFSLDEARAELARRWADVDLREAIEAEFGDLLAPEFRKHPRGVISRQLISPDNGFAFFVQAARYIGSIPFAWEYHGDLFSKRNREKRSLGRLMATGQRGNVQIDLFAFSSNDGKKIDEIATHTGESLVGFHHRLLEIGGYEIEYRDMTRWCRHVGKPVDYYYPLLLHFVAHGVLFENVFTSDERDNSFSNMAILPAMQKIHQKFGLRPLIARLYPDEETQTEEEDFYWWCYPPNVNKYLLSYAQENHLPIRQMVVGNEEISQ